MKFIGDIFKIISATYTKFIRNFKKNVSATYTKVTGDSFYKMIGDIHKNYGNFPFLARLQPFHDSERFK